MTGTEEIRRRAAVVDDAVLAVQSARVVVERLRGIRWRSPAALAYRAELAHVGEDLDRSRAILVALAGDLRTLAALLARGRHG